MKKLASILAIALAAAGCQPAADLAQPYRDAMPAKESVQLGSPSADGTAAPTALVALSGPERLTADNTASAVTQYPDQSEFATVSYWAAVGINGGTWWTLTLVQLVTAYPATTCDDQSCTWGPWLGDDQLNNWKLEVTKDGDGYAWAFSGQDAVGQTGALPRPWVVLISGLAFKGVDRQHGHGDFTIDFEAQASLAHGPGWTQRDFGTVTIVYDNTTDVSVQATALNGKNADPLNPHALNAVYSFFKSGPGGSIDIGIDNLDTNEFVKLDTQWNGTGAGRGDAIYSPDGVATTGLLTECWNGAAASWGEVYDNSAPDAKGTEDLCAFTAGDPAAVVLPAR